MIAHWSRPTFPPALQPAATKPNFSSKASNSISWEVIPPLSSSLPRDTHVVSHPLDRYMENSIALNES